MARPCKSASLLKERSINKDESESRTKNEKKLKGSSNRIIPPDYLSDEQKKIFTYIVSELKASGILGNLDVFVLSTCCIAIDRLATIERSINADPKLLCDKELMSSKDKYTKDFFRCCNELSLSPQSRAKIGNLNLQAKEENPLLKVLSDD